MKLLPTKEKMRPSVYFTPSFCATADFVCVSLDWMDTVDLPLNEQILNYFSLQDRGCTMDVCGELIGGTIAGVLSKIVEYPFDTVKVRLQAEGNPYKGAWDCARRISLEEGFPGFFRGVTAPIAGAAFENAGAFLFYGRSRAFVRYWLDIGENEPIPDVGVFFCGAMAGVATGTVLTPVELLKCRVQDEQQRAAAAGKPPKYRGVAHCAVLTVRGGGAGALFNGYSATLAREIPGSAMWFGCYELSLKVLFTPVGGTKDQCPWYAFPLSGVIGGLCYWSSMFPMDSVKTRMQLDNAYNSMGLVAATKIMVKREGFRALYAGYGVTIMRAFPSNATIFTTFELTQRWWKGRNTAE